MTRERRINPKCHSPVAADQARLARNAFARAVIR